MAIFVATYDYAAGTDTQRDALRAAHRDWLGEQPSLLASGPTDAEGAVLIFEGDSAADVERLLDGDPFAPAGVIETRRVVGWQVVRGRWRAPLGLD
jgi:uncharacterized protein YciI